MLCCYDIHNMTHATEISAVLVQLKDTLMKFESLLARSSFGGLGLGLGLTTI